MSKRNLFIAAIILIALAAITQWVTSPENKKTDNLIDISLVPKDLVGAFDEVVIENNEAQIHLLVKNDQWIIKEQEEFPADDKELLKLIDNITSYKISSLVTKDPERLAHFNLKYKSENGSKESLGTALTLKEKGKEVHKILVGKKRESQPSKTDPYPQPGGTYIRVGDTPSVYLIKENLTVETNAEEWIQKRLFGFEKEQIKSIKYEQQNTRFLLEREDKGKELIIANLGKNEKISDYERSSLLTDLTDFKIDQIVMKSKQPESDLELKSIITITPYDEAAIAFQVLAKEDVDPLGKEEKKKEKKYTYFIKILDTSAESKDTKIQPVHELAKKWLFQVDEWKAKRWLKTKKDYIVPEEPK